MGSGASTPAPHLAEYFQQLKKETEVTDEKLEEFGMAVLCGTADSVQNKAKELAEWYEKEGKPILTKSFQHHDKDKSNALENAEAKVFFLNLIQETETFIIAMQQSMKLAALERTAQMIKGLPGAEAAPMFVRNGKAQIKKTIAAQKKDYDKRIAAYKKDKDALDDAAFKVMDTSADGKIQLEEFLNIFAPDSDKMPSILVALGLMTEQEKVMQEQIKAMAAHAPDAAAVEAAPAAAAPAAAAEDTPAAAPEAAAPAAAAEAGPAAAPEAAAPAAAAEAAPAAAPEAAAPAAAAAAEAAPAAAPEAAEPVAA